MNAFRAPGWIFHVLLLVPALLLLWATSVPGLLMVHFAAAFWLLVAAALAWAVWAVLYVVALRKGRAGGSGWRFAIAPVLGVAVAGILLLDLPLRARWELSQDAFDEYVEQLDDADRVAGDPSPIEPPGRLGWFDINRVDREGDVVLLFERNGLFTHYAGFAYMPDGPDPGLASGSFESPSYTHLRGPWYAFTASW